MSWDCLHPAEQLTVLELGTTAVTMWRRISCGACGEVRWDEVGPPTLPHLREPNRYPPTSPSPRTAPPPAHNQNMTALAQRLADFADELARDIPLSRDRDSHMRAVRQANIAADLARQARLLQGPQIDGDGPASAS